MQGGAGKVASNDYQEFPDRYRLNRIFTMQLRGSACFDFDYYRANNPDLKDFGDDLAWTHFLQYGQFEGRKLM